MNRNTLGFIVVAFMIGPVAANAQLTTLEYQGSAIIGTTTYLPQGYLATDGNVVLPTTPFIGSVTGSIVLDGSISENNLSLVSYSFTLSGTDFINGVPTSFGVAFSSGPAPFGGAPEPGTSDDFCTYGCIDLTTTNGAITGAVVSDFTNDTEYSSQTALSIGSGGDSVLYLYADGPFGSCENFSGQYPGSPAYTGGTVNPCELTGNSKAAGAWIVSTAPEIDATLAAGGFTLMFGGIMVTRGRRPRRSQEIFQ